MAKRILVDLWRQVLTAYEGDRTIYTFDCVSGDRNHNTETVEKRLEDGTVYGSTVGDVVKHKVLRKDRHCVSRRYDNTPMPYALFFTDDGKAIHQGVAVGLLSYLKWMQIGNIGSHGCVRLAEDHAGQLFTWTPIGTEVIVMGHACNNCPAAADVEKARKEAGVPAG